MDAQSGRNSDTSPGDLVAQVNTVVEDEPLDAGDWPEPLAGPDIGEQEDIPTRAPVLQAALLGAIALIVIAISMFLILQGVFEMIPS